MLYMCVYVYVYIGCLFVFSGADLKVCVSVTVYLLIGILYIQYSL